MWGFVRFVVATAAGAGLGAGAALARRHLVAPPQFESPLAPPAPTLPDADATPGLVQAPAAEPVVAPPSPEAPALDVADLEAARARLRERAAQLRAEMERSAQ